MTTIRKRQNREEGIDTLPVNIHHHTVSVSAFVISNEEPEMEGDYSVQRDDLSTKEDK